MTLVEKFCKTNNLGLPLTFYDKQSEKQKVHWVACTTEELFYYWLLYFFVL